MTVVRVRVPASTANLGSGFDALGLALGLYDEVEVATADEGLRIEVHGEGASEVALDEGHLVVRAVLAGAAQLGMAVPGLTVRCANAIPHARGLGSSAAAIVAGVAAAYALAGLDARKEPGALQLAARFEGHADNVAASLFGGLVLAWQDNEQFEALRLEPHESVRPVVCIPEHPSATATTRGLLPERVPHVDAAFAAARCALAVQAITTRPDLLLPATQDRLHQDYREQAWPDTMRLVRELRDAGVPATVSGAGPTVFAFTSDGTLPPGVDTADYRVLELPVDRTGVRCD
ncbi:homoserine kinase [Labedaea rhizosphaerae]|nr:homoserine kinase [Labedaea rhizosphaerae]